MKKYLLYTLLITISSTCGLLSNDTIRICTYNIRRMGSEDSPKNLWQNRKGLVFDMINTIQPDIIGFQEVIKEQLHDLQTVLSDYASFGESRSTKTKGWLQRWVMKHPKAKDEYNPIFYNKSKFELLKSDTFGINPRAHFLTAYLPRVCTWGLFKDLQTGKKFYIYNTHLDNSSSLIRKRQMSQILKHVEKKTKAERVVLVGDFNNRFKGRSKQRKLNRYNFVNSKKVAQIVEGPEETRTGWNNSEFKTIDYIFVKPQSTIVKKHVVVESPAEIFPSDHRPVYIDMVE
jgi:endonuclease/exonuclease/phosphatase family metal-dependent hydrolase